MTLASDITSKKRFKNVKNLQKVFDFVFVNFLTCIHNMKIVKQFCPPSKILLDSAPSTAPCFRFTKLDTSGILLADSDESCSVKSSLKKSSISFEEAEHHELRVISGSVFQKESTLTGQLLYKSNFNVIIFDSFGQIQWKK